jgi:prepilin-type N-terminal cleavage/methylation domain-containing protein
VRRVPVRRPALLALRGRGDPDLNALLRGRHLRSEERGFTIIEVVVALTVLAIGAVAFGTTTTTGLQLVGVSKERQTAVQVANEWTEQARAVPYSALALDSATVFGGTGTPDENVSGTTYTGAGGAEALVLTAGSTFPHTGTETPNGVNYSVYRYVTWVADGVTSQAYKRVTVVVQWQGTSTSTAPKRLTQSTMIATNGVVWSATTTTGVPASTTTTTIPATTTTTAAGACTGDHTGPTGTLSILAGTGANTGYTSSSTVTLSLTASDPCAPVTMAFSNDNVTYSTAEAFATSKAWPLTSGNGNRTVWVRYADGVGNASVASATVRVDGTIPTTPGSFTATSVSGPTRVVLTWTASTDNDSLIGYRIYVAAANGSFQNQPTGVTAPCSTNPCTWTHAGVKNKDVYTYYVVAYDAAGNTSVSTAQKTVTV